VPFKACNLQISMAMDSRNSKDSPLRRPDVCQKVLGFNDETTLGPSRLQQLYQRWLAQVNAAKVHTEPPPSCAVLPKRQGCAVIRRRQQAVRTGRHRMSRSHDRSPKRTPLCRLDQYQLRQVFRPGRQQDIFSYWCQSLKIPALPSSASGWCAAWAVRDNTDQP
jgi:hypothetical protein